MKRTQVVTFHCLIAIFVGLSVLPTAPHVPLAGNIAEVVTQGVKPPALTPFAHDDPIPKLSLKPSSTNDTPRQVAESFLAYLSEGYHPTAEVQAGGTHLGGDRKGYEKAWALMGPERPAFNDFLARWAGTLRIGVVQLEPINPWLFFVEVERVGWSESHWAVSYFAGELAVAPTNQGWKVQSFALCPENLAMPNIIGHTSWHQDDQALAAIAGGFKWGEYDVLSQRFRRRTVVIRLRNNNTGEVKTFRMARVVEGAWKILEPRGWPSCT